MERRPFKLICRMIALLAFCLSAVAGEDEAAAFKESDWAQRLEKAASLQAAGKARQSEADKMLENKQSECLKKFLVISCQKDAEAEHLVTAKETRQLINEGKAIEREVKKEKLELDDKRRQEQAPQREADRESRLTETAAARDAAAAEAAAARAKKASEAEAGSQRKAKEAEKALQKRQAHEAKLAKKKAAAERRAATAESQ